MSIVTVPQGDQAPLGAPCAHDAASFFDMPLLTELETTFSDVPFYRHAAPNGAIACLRQGAQTLARTGKVSVSDKLVRFTRPGLTEEYSVSVDGVRQDFVIESPPLNPQRSTLNQSAGDLRVELALSGARAEAAAYGARLRLDGSGRALAYSRLRVEDATGRELTARLEVLSPDRLAVSVADANATYPVRIDPTFSDADWVSLNPGMPGANDSVVPSRWTAMAMCMSAATSPSLGRCRPTTSPNGTAAPGRPWARGSAATGLCAGGERDQSLRRGKLHHGGRGAGQQHRQMGRQRLVGLGLGDGWHPCLCVDALAVSGTNLYAGGDFTTAGGVKANYIAKWDGSAWSALGSGMGGGTIRLCAGGERDHSLRGGILHLRRAGCRPTTSPNGTAAPGRPWARG